MQEKQGTLAKDIANQPMVQSNSETASRFYKLIEKMEKHKHTACFSEIVKEIP